MKNFNLGITGILFLIPSCLIAFLAVVFTQMSIIPNYQIQAIKIPIWIISILIIFIGIMLFIGALRSGIMTSNPNKLITTGSYQLVRHPMYSGMLFTFSGIIFATNNLFLFVIPIFLWLYLSLLLISIEEKQLISKFGTKYQNYAKKVNRCLPKV